MARFFYGDIRAEMTCSVRDGLMAERLFGLFRISPQPTPVDNNMTHVLRSLCIIAAYSKNVEGLIDKETGRVWQPPGTFDSDEEIEANFDFLLKILPRDSDLLAMWVRALNAFLFGEGTLASKELQGTGNPETDPLPKRRQESFSDSLTTPPEQHQSPSRSQRRRNRRRQKTR